MLLDTDDALRAAVRTASGTHLGKVVGAIIQTEGQTLHQYRVKPAGISHLFDTKELLVHRDQVIRITQDAIIVDDAAADLQADAENAQQKNEPQLPAEVVTQNK